MNHGLAAMSTLLGLGVAFCLMAASVAHKQSDGGRRAAALAAAAESIGMCTLALACEGSYSRVVLEGPGSCLGEMPGGYCLHAACDTCACPVSVGHVFTMTRTGGRQ